MKHDACMTEDARYRAEMEHSSETMLSVLRGRQSAPRGLRWSLVTGGRGDRHIYKPVVLRIAERDRMAEIQRTQRDCCPRCGARGDADCGHATISGGRLVCL